MNDVHILENVGGGLTAAIYPHLPQNYIQVRLKQVAVVHNFLVQNDLKAEGSIVQFKLMPNAGGDVYTSLESVEVSNNALVESRAF